MPADVAVTPSIRVERAHGVARPTLDRPREYASADLEKWAPRPAAG